MIPSLIEKGYSPEDAHEYVVAACWEFIVPKCGTDIPNIDALSLVDCVSFALADLPTCATFDEFYSLVERQIKARAGRNVPAPPQHLYEARADDVGYVGRNRKGARHFVRP